jgi:outer membrane usher protein
VKGFAAAAIVCASIALLGATAATNPAASESIYAVRINGLLVSNGTIVAVDANGDILVQFDDLRRWRITPHAPGSEINGVRYVKLSALPGVRQRISTADMTLDLDVPPAIFDRTSIDLAAANPPKPLPASGALLKYDAFLTSAPNAGFQFAGFADIGGFRGNESFGSTFVAGATTGGQRVVRLDTQWHRDFDDSVMRVGDATLTGSTLFPATRFAGIQWATDFALQPYLVTYPVPTFEGIATAPTVLDVLINGEQAASVAIPAGPYDISGLTLPSGAGTVQLTARDLAGRIFASASPFYAGTALLKRGLSSSSTAFGVERQAFGESSFDYGSALGSFTRRIGISDRSTLEADAGFAAGSLSAGIANDVLVDDFGVLTTGFGVSSGRSSGGFDAVLGLAHADRSFGYSVREQIATAGFAAPGSEPHGRSPVRSEQVALGFDAGRFGALQAAYALQTDATGTKTATVIAALNSRLRLATIRLAYVRTVAPTPENGASLSLSVPIGPGRTLNISGVAQRFGGGATVQTAQDLPAGGPGVGYAISSGRMSGVENDAARVVGATDAMNFSADVERTGNAVSTSAGASGVAGVLDGRPFSSRQIGAQAFGIVELGGFANVRIFVNNAYAGRSGSDGRLTVTLLPYQANDVRFEPTDLPIDATIGDVHKVVSTRAGGGAVIEFDVRGPDAASATVVDGIGVPLSTGSIVTSASESFVVGFGGEVYLTDLKRGPNVFHGEIAGRTCSFVVNVGQTLAAGTNLGTFSCR